MKLFSIGLGALLLGITVPAVRAQETGKPEPALAAAYLREKGLTTLYKGRSCEFIHIPSSSLFGLVTICYTSAQIKEQNDDSLLVKIGDAVSYTDIGLDGSIDKIELGTIGPMLWFKPYYTLDKQAAEAHQSAYTNIVKEYVAMKREKENRN